MVKDFLRFVVHNGMIYTTSEEFKLAHEGVVGPDPPGDTARDPMVVMLPAWIQEQCQGAWLQGARGQGQQPQAQRSV